MCCCAALNTYCTHPASGEEGLLAGNPTTFAAFVLSAGLFLSLCLGPSACRPMRPSRMLRGRQPSLAFAETVSAACCSQRVHFCSCARDLKPPWQPYSLIASASQSTTHQQTNVCSVLLVLPMSAFSSARKPCAAQTCASSCHAACSSCSCAACLTCRCVQQHAALLAKRQLAVQLHQH